MQDKDYYAVLGVERNADEKTIQRAFRRLAKKYHPDTNQGNASAEQKFKQINEAYAVLGDKTKRQQYDRYGTAAFQDGFDPKAYEAFRNFKGSGFGTSGFSGGFGNAGFGNSGFGGSGFGSSGFGQDIHFEGGEDFDDILKNMFGRGTGRGRASAPADTTADLQVTFMEAALGCEKRITLGAGGGTVSVRIPAGIEEGKRIRLRGRGRAAAPGGAAGDLYLRIHILPDARFERKGKDIYTTVFVPYPTAVLGGEVQAPALRGKVLCRIPAGTQCGSRIRLKGKGIQPGGNAAEAGDEYIVVQIQVPRSVTEEQKKLLRAYAEESTPVR